MRTYFIAAIACLGLTVPQAFGQSEGKVLAPAISSQYSAKLLAPTATAAFHTSQAGQTVWEKDANYDALITALEGLAQHGLTPSEYHLEALKAQKNDKGLRDRLATDAWFSAAAHMTYGKLNPKTYEPDWTAAKRNIDLAGILSASLSEGSIGDSLENLAPKQASYKALKDEYVRLKADAEIPITKIPAGVPLKSGMKGDRVARLQTRLMELALLPADTVPGSFEVDTVTAVQTFQTQQDLDSDGIVGGATLKALNSGAEQQINQLKANLERWRWLPEDLGRRHVRANIAGFNVTTWENGAPVRTHLTIVGKTYRKTPVFSDEIEYAVFNPWWETPPSLARADKLPLFKRDPGAVERLGFQILDKSGAVVNPETINWSELTASDMPYRMRQKPGPLNALGVVKIIFPNVHNVYFHDTPTRDLFAQRQRAFSSGCMRTQDPVDLAKWLLSETPEWTSAKIDEAVASGKETRAVLKEKVPVHVLYFTAVREADGNVRFLDDIYDRDGSVLAGLEKSAPAG